jgi:hypothetical protein
MRGRVVDKIRIREEIRGFIPGIKSQRDVYGLFRVLNYPDNVFFEPGSKRKLQDFDFKEEFAKEIDNIYTVLSFEKNIPVFLFEVAAVRLPLLRYITKKLSDKYIRFLLVITSDYETITLLFPEYEKVSTGEHKIKITRLVINKNDLYWTDIETITNLFYEGKEDSWRDVWRKWRDAFSVEKVTEKFFEDYKNAFFLLRNELVRQKFSRKEAHEFTLQFLNRLMFLYFISKKKWLNDDTKFMKWLWNRYLVERNKEKKSQDSFYDNWLKQIFFRAFNNRQFEISGLPEDVKEILSQSPYLNGGLFTENETDKLEVKISDSLFRKIFDFYESYNFTIKEDMPLEQEVAVDPQMIGYVYESLANVAEEIYDRNDLGIFYTPRVEVDFMCRRTLVEYLSKNIPEIPKEQFYRFVFDDEKEAIEKLFEKGDHWRRIEECLDNLSVVDPACGSGAFLVGMLNVLYELYKVVYRYIKRGFSEFSLKEEIIGRSLYGVDVMPWAAHAAELRLWLQLIVETELSPEELRKKPLLPNLNLNIRVGDSLVQEIGGLNLHFRTTLISERMKRKLNALKAEKGKYFLNLSAKFSKREQFIEEEAKVFEEIIEDRINTLLNDARITKAKIDRLKGIKQFNLYGDIPESEQKKLFDERAELQENLDKIESQIEGLKNIRENLKKPEKKPFIWDIDFAEIFGEKGGFDIVIGNPPYVRQEMISPPNRLKAEVSSRDRQEYKEKLLKSVTSCYSVVDNVDRKSDYYIYFYFHGLSLLNAKGTFCFITSNSWLDVDFGKELQEFLLKYVPIIAIIDSPKRSFKHSDINTVIVLFGCPKIEFERIFGLEVQKELNWPAITNTAKFIMLRKPISEIIASKTLLDIENIKVIHRGENITDYVKNVVKTDDYRVFPIIQADLIEDGWEYPEDYDKKHGRFKAGNYEGNKWGGKYLKAPDIFYTIIEKGKVCFIELGKLAKVRRGFTTGANEFFYLDKDAEERWKIERNFLKPVIKSPKECKSLFIASNDLKYRVFLCRMTKKELKNTNALKYIEWGEDQAVEVKSGGEKGKKVKGYHKLETVKNRRLWYELSVKEYPDAVWVKSIHDNHGQSIIKDNCLVDQRLYEIYFPEKISIDAQAILLNNSIFYLFKEIAGRTNLGEGVLDTAVFEAKKCLVFKPDRMGNRSLRKNIEFRSVFEESGIDPYKPIREQNPMPLDDRNKIDQIVFDELGLTQEERKEVYYALCELVKERLVKANSLKGD